MPRPKNLTEKIVRPLRDVYLRHFVSPEDDPWEHVNTGLKRFLFGDDLPEPFKTLPDGGDRVPVESIDELCSWLQGCEYVSDEKLFGQEDFWQHPQAFEKLRKGDCEDHALWAWRKMDSLDHPAHFYLGRWQGPEGGAPNAHAWVVFEWGGQDYLMETVLKQTPNMVYSLASAKDRYSPHFSVSSKNEVQMYVGFLQFLRERRVARSPGEPDPATARSPRPADDPSARPDPAHPATPEPQ